MAREIEWKDAQEIGILLQEKYPEVEPYSLCGWASGICGRSAEVDRTDPGGDSGSVERRVGRREGVVMGHPRSRADQREDYAKQS
jgi:hypothetical protein